MNPSSKVLRAVSENSLKTVKEGAKEGMGSPQRSIPDLKVRIIPLGYIASIAVYFHCALTRFLHYGTTRPFYTTILASNIYFSKIHSFDVSCLDIKDFILCKIRLKCTYNYKPRQNIRLLFMSSDVVALE